MSSVAPANDLEIAFWGLRRSGNHAVIAWIVSLFEGPVGFFNDLNHSRPLTPQTASDNLPGFPAARRAFAGDRGKRLCIYSYEDPDLAKNRALEPPRHVLGASSRKLDVLLLRDPYNMLASRLKILHERKSDHVAGEMLEHDGLSIVSLWMQHAKEFLGESRNLEDGVLAMNYNRWVFDEDYRREICRLLGGAYSEKTLPFIPRYGFGSSFEGSLQPRLLNRLGLLHRWRHLKEDPLFRELIDDPELRKFSDRIFGPVLS